MVKDSKILGIPVVQAISLATFIAGIISVWVHLEIQIAAINVEIINLKKNEEQHCADNRKELDALKVDIKSDTREILKKIDEIQVYLRNQSNQKP
jgi:formiminotetrahydrofolate cyclodeaminase